VHLVLWICSLCVSICFRCRFTCRYNESAVLEWCWRESVGRQCTADGRDSFVRLSWSPRSCLLYWAPQWAGYLSTYWSLVYSVVSFYPCNAMLARVLAISCVSVCVYVCHNSHATIVSKRLHGSSWFFLRMGFPRLIVNCILRKLWYL